MVAQGVPILHDAVIIADKDSTPEEIQILKQALSAIDMTLLVRQAIMDAGLMPRMAEKVTYEVLLARRLRR